jgi:hypothetical protein
MMRRLIRVNYLLRSGSQIAYLLRRMNLPQLSRQSPIGRGIVSSYEM